MLLGDKGGWNPRPALTSLELEAEIEMVLLATSWQGIYPRFLALEVISRKQLSSLI